MHEGADLVGADKTAIVRRLIQKKAHFGEDEGFLVGVKIEVAVNNPSLRKISGAFLSADKTESRAKVRSRPASKSH